MEIARSHFGRGFYFRESCRLSVAIKRRTYTRRRESRWYCLARPRAYSQRIFLRSPLQVSRPAPRRRLRPRWLGYLIARPLRPPRSPPRPRLLRHADVTSLTPAARCEAYSPFSLSASLLHSHTHAFALFDHSSCTV